MRFFIFYPNQLIPLALSLILLFLFAACGDGEKLEDPTSDPFSASTGFKRGSDASSSQQKMERAPKQGRSSQRALDTMSADAQANFFSRRARAAFNPNALSIVLFRKEMEFQYAFAKAGGLLVAGVDPTGNGGALPGFGDLRNIELLVEAGFTIEEAIQISTANGAKLLGESKRIGTITVGKQADLVIVDGNPAADVSEIMNVRTVFKDGIGYDSLRLIDSVRGAVGRY